MALLVSDPLYLYSHSAPTAPFLTLWVPDTLNAFGLLSGPCSLLPRMFAQVIHCAWEPLPPSLPTSTNEGSNSPNLFCKFLLQNCAVREISPGLQPIRSPLLTLTVPGPSPCSSRHNCTVLIPCTEWGLFPTSPSSLPRFPAPWGQGAYLSALAHLYPLLGAYWPAE